MISQTFFTFFNATLGIFAAVALIALAIVVALVLAQLVLFFRSWLRNFF